MMQWSQYIANPRASSATRDEIVDSAARAFYVDTWANRIEEREGMLPRGDLMDAAPSTPRSAERFARKFIKEVERMNRGIPIDDLYERAANMPGKHYRAPTPSDFGHYLAMEAMGHGVGWHDDHPKVEPAIAFPGADYYYGGTGEIGGRWNEI
jgi:hypothetical protein